MFRYMKVFIHDLVYMHLCLNDACMRASVYIYHTSYIDVCIRKYLIDIHSNISLACT